ncbi:membrane protein [Companilactobacillus sp. RD055328]|uniref:DMT family transporter n=1 Tax=Companilactobacillus sp. RD055328 TaxID=2916634 RepID=UPI001FC88F89|nr:DMT family transporter [Companilactobacillus sp. RD055328]GKQ43311.1 membrane protein [Companilactobacillus sp. RD055328]
MKTDKQTMHKFRTKGFILALIASSLWGVSGAVLQFVSKNKAIPAEWFIGVRTLIAGAIILFVAFISLPKGKKKDFFAIFTNKKDVLLLLLFSIFGLIGNMYTFFLSIQHGNAASATILQYLSPLFIVLGGIVFLRQKPTRVDVISFVMALFGIVLLITKGNFSHLSIPMDSLIWGILSGVTAAMYIIFPARLIQKYSPLLVTGWGFMVSGILFNIYHPFWIDPPKLDTGSILGVGTVILIGSVAAFLIMVMSLQYTTSTIVSITDAVQPFITFVLSILFLGSTFSIVEIIGSIIVIFAIYILNRFN